MTDTAILSDMKKNKGGNLTNIAYDTIKHSIFNNEIKPGDYLSENTIAQTLGMSRTPIREALKILASEGLIEIHNGVGVFVKHVTIKEIYELFEVRAALECAALQSFLDNITEAEIDQMEREWLDFKSRIKSGGEINIDAISEQDYKLHILIVDKCNNTYLKNIMKSIRLKISRYQLLSAKALGNEVETINQHLEILNVIREKDIDKLTKLLKVHIREAAENIAKNPNWIY
ncbi:MAG: hypothetical protein APF77_20520 [Clostridia bacterium BRH_c25]|nr:MAG: hypothetical protein APF77_20520 [Clostridia bacterium BRH_c25]